MKGENWKLTDEGNETRGNACHHKREKGMEEMDGYCGFQSGGEEKIMEGSEIRILDKKIKGQCVLEAFLEF